MIDDRPTRDARPWQATPNRRWEMLRGAHDQSKSLEVEPYRAPAPSRSFWDSSRSWALKDRLRRLAKRWMSARDVQATSQRAWSPRKGSAAIKELEPSAAGAKGESETEPSRPSERARRSFAARVQNFPARGAAFEPRWQPTESEQRRVGARGRLCICATPPTPFPTCNPTRNENALDLTSLPHGTLSRYSQQSSFSYEKKKYLRPSASIPIGLSRKSSGEVPRSIASEMPSASSASPRRLQSQRA